ncbi:MAG TPA: hypothetical protein VGK19_08020 [Capsulimonadaceae bacterium]|jgi:hypothetical protein
MQALDPQSLINWLNTLPYPRPFVWQRFVYWRRAVYGLVSIVMLIGCVGWPLYNGLDQAHGLEPMAKLLNSQVMIFFGALIVIAFVRVSVQANKLFDDCKSLSRFGAVGEANLLWVLGDEKSSLVTYRFFDLHGRERTREAFISAENGQSLPPLAAGDVIPVLFDPHKPDQRNLLWIEITRYVRISASAQRAQAAAAPTVAAR